MPAEAALNTTRAKIILSFSAAKFATVTTLSNDRQRASMLLLFYVPGVWRGCWRRVIWVAYSCVRGVFYRLQGLVDLIRRLFRVQHFTTTKAGFSRAPPAPRTPHHGMRELLLPQGLAVMDTNTLPRGLSARRRGSVDPIKVSQILPLGAPNSPKQPPPAERLAPPASPTTAMSFENASSRPPSATHRRSGSLADSVRPGKRLSLNFPIQTSGLENGRTSRPQSWITTASNTPITSPEIPPSPTKSTDFLTALAAQERKVLELREELQKAETELSKLKKEWQATESMRKRDDMRRVQQLQPLNATLSSVETTDDDTDGTSLWLQKEMDRRRAVLSGVRNSNRKVFSGSRHTRTLSLLSPDKETMDTPSRRSVDFGAPSPAPSSNDETPKLTRSSTASSIARQVASLHPVPKFEVPNSADASDPGTPHEAILQSGKKLATDVKEGLWTFWEDLRQATVGEEGVHGTQTRPHRVSRTATAIRHQSSRGSLKSKTRPTSKRAGSSFDTRPKSMPPKARTFDEGDLIDIGGSFWRENGLDEPKTAETPRKVVKKASKKGMKGSPSKAKQHQQHLQETPKSVSDDDAWDTWDSPKSNATPQQNDAALNALEGSRGSARSGESTSKEAIPWPSLVKLSPSNLKRTASHLMNEWERSLTPPADGGEEKSDYLNHEASPDVTTLLR